MTAREYLGQLRKCSVRIAIIREDVMRLRSRLESVNIGISGDKVQTSPKDNFSETMARIIDRQTELERLCSVYDEMMVHILDEILQMPNEIYSSILYKRYAVGLSLGEIAGVLHYSVDRVKHLHGDALRAFEAQYPKVKDL